MYRIRLFLSVLIVLGLLTQASGHAIASIPAPSEVQKQKNLYDSALEMACHEDICEFHLQNSIYKSMDVSGTDENYLVRANHENVRILPGNKGIVIDETVSLNLPVGFVDLFDSKLTLTLTSDYSISSITGSAQVPFSLFGTTDAESRMNVNIGLESGKTLRSRYRNHSLEPLDANQKYVFFYIGPESTSITKQDTGVTSLSIPRGQSFLLIHDPFQAFVYADGKFSIEFPSPATPASVLAAGTLLSGGTLLPFLLFKHSPTVHVSWLVTPDLKDAFLEIDGEYAISEGLLSKIASTDLATIGVGGSLRIDQDGVVLRGVTETTFVAGKLFDGGLAVETFIPFQEGFWDARVVLGGHVAIPILAFRSDAESRLDGTVLQYLVAGMLPAEATPKRQPIYILAKDRTSDAVVLAGQRMQGLFRKTSYSYQWTIEGMQSSADSATILYTSAKEYAGTQFDWVSTTVSNTVASSSEATQIQIERSKNFTSEKYNQATGVISSTFSSAVDAVQVGIGAGTQTITETTNSAIDSMTDGFESVIESTKEVTEDVPENVMEQTACTLNAVRRTWCLRTGLCEVPTECQPDDANTHAEAGTSP